MPRARTTASVLAAALLVALCLAAPAPASTRSGRSSAGTPLPDGFVGMVVDQPVWPDPFVDLSKQMDVMVSSGVDTVRVVFDWANAQPYKRWREVPADERHEFASVGGIPTNFTVIDQLVGAAAAHGLTVLPTILNAPSWDGQSYQGGVVELPRSLGPFAAFVKGLVRRYGRGGTFWSTDRSAPPVPIQEWQIWNEPNIPAFWPPQPYYARYLKLLAAAHAAIKRADPSAKVILAGLPNYSWLELARLYSHRGARNLFDVVAVHPYTRTPAGVITILSYVRAIMNQAGDATKPIIADEVSWPSSLGETTHNVGYDFATTESGQARNIGLVMPLLARNRARLGLAGFYYYDWAGLERRDFLAFDFSGLFRIAGGAFEPKPAYTVFKREALSLEGCRGKGVQASVCLR